MIRFPKWAWGVCSAWLLLAVAATAIAQENPVKLATQMRLDVNSSGAAGDLKNITILSPRGTIERSDGRVDSARAFGVTFPLVRFATNEIVIGFETSGTGPLGLSLQAPWEQATAETFYVQSVLVDWAEAKGGEVAGWDTIQWPLPISTLHSSSLRVDATNGVPVRLRVLARPVIPKDFADMKPLSDLNSPAHQAARRFRHGVNLGNYLEAPTNQSWGARYSTNDFAHIAAEGFDHVRLPVAWHHYSGPAPEFQLSEEIFAKADFLVTNALARGLNVIVNVHHFDAFTSDPDGQADKLFVLWRQIAAHYAKSPAGVAFELLNEPKDKATTTKMNPIYARLIRQIRASNPRRTLFVGPGRWNQVEELGDLRLPDDDANLIVTVHCYEPFYFTHQGASWTKPATDTRGIVFPGPPLQPLAPSPTVVSNTGVLKWLRSYNTLPAERNPSSAFAFRHRLQLARQWSDYYGRPVHVGEFGCYVGADAVSRMHFHEAFRQALDEFDLGWALWDWKAGFRYWVEAKDEPSAGLRRALFPKSAK